MFLTFSPKKMLALSNTQHSTLCSLLHYSSANGYIDDTHLQMLICKWKWWHWRYSTRGNYLHRFWMKLTFTFAKWISAFLAPRTVVDELLESESFSNKFVKLCSHETFFWENETSFTNKLFPHLKTSKTLGKFKALSIRSDNNRLLRRRLGVFYLFMTFCMNPYFRRGVYFNFHDNIFWVNLS